MARSRIASFCDEQTFEALEAKDDIDGSENVDTKDGTTNDWLGLPCAECPPKAVPAANKLAAELASDSKDSGMPPKHGGVVEMEFAAG